MVHAFNPITLEAETGGSPSLRSDESAEYVPGQTGLHRKPLYVCEGSGRAQGDGMTWDRQDLQH